jgi:OHCU decarboxylase
MSAKNSVNQRITNAMRYRLSEINAMGETTFVRVFGGVFEASPWAATQAWTRAPFETFDSLIDALCRSVLTADLPTQLELLCAHPELGSNRKMTEASAKEQTDAGLQTHNDANRNLLAQLNREYRTKFGFPFIIAVKGLPLEQIVAVMHTRIRNNRSTEFSEGLQQVFTIARLRLQELLHQ